MNQAIEKKFLSIKAADRDCDSYLACPKQGQHPAVILYMDAFGPRPYLYEMADKIAEHGYVVLIPNILYRIKKAPFTDGPFPLTKEKSQEVIGPLLPSIRGFSMDDGMRDTKTFLDHLSHLPQVKKGSKVGVTGYCMGGRIAIAAAETFPAQIAAVLSFHGGNLAPDSADGLHTRLNKIQGELYVAHADQDPSMPVDQIERFETALKESQIRGRTEIYVGSPHGFTMKDLPHYNEKGLALHWVHLFQVLDRNLLHA